MELYTIYEDANIKIEILKILHDYFDRTTVKWIEFSNAAKSILYGEILQDLKPKFEYWDVKDELTPMKAIVINPIYSVSLSTPFNIFNKVLDFISLAIYSNKTQSEIEKEFEEVKLVEEGELILKFFEEPIFKANGYLAYYNKEVLLILLFSIKEE